MKSKIYRFDPVIYPIPLLVARDFDINEIPKQFWFVRNEKEVRELDPSELDAAPMSIAKTLPVVDKSTGNMFILVLLYDRKRITEGIITHESGHACTFIADHLGFGGRTPENDEPFAYFEGWISDCIASVLKGHPEKMKGTYYIKPKEDEDGTAKEG